MLISATSPAWRAGAAGGDDDLAELRQPFADGGRDLVTKAALCGIDVAV